jgi:hypothetical protein
MVLVVLVLLIKVTQVVMVKTVPLREQVVVVAVQTL